MRFCLVPAVAFWCSLAGCYANGPSTRQGTNYPGNAVAVPAHRLNRAEYNATVRDLLPTTSTPADAFPNDTASVNGLDNMASDLVLSPSLFADYEQAAHDLAHEIVDPLDTNAVPPLYAPAHAWMSCSPQYPGTTACAQQIITAFATRAWRRPLSANDAANLMVLWQAQTFDWNTNLRAVLAAILMSPRFVFRLEPVQAGATGAVPLDAYQVASRLSYFLWSSLPDSALLAAAADGSLLTPAGILTQTQRMLADPKAAALSTNFAAQWLDARYLPQASPDPNVFPAFNPNIAQAMVDETRLFFQHFLNSPEPVQNMFTATYTFGNDALATYYGLAAPGSATAVQLDTPNRNGVLSLGAWLTVTSMPNRTSPTKRGVWILTQLMCTTPPPVPAGVNPSLPANPDPNSTIRQQMSAHDTDPACAACHSLIDPPGYGLENFTGVAQFRSSYPTQPIDPSGTLPSGATFNSLGQLGQLLSQDPRFPACLTAKLFAYATGSLPTAATQPLLDQVGSQWAAQNYSLPALVNTIVISPAFRTRLVTP